MEKVGLVRGRTPFATRKTCAVCLLALVLWLFTRPNIFPDEVSSNLVDCSGTPSTNNQFQWNKLVPNDELRWVSCYTAFECARLQVPLNYENGDNGKAAIAVVRYPTKLSRAHGGYKGPILFNPGGPGGSGVEAVLTYGPHFQGILGDDYDMVGFDPRGIGYTTPVVDVFDTSLERAAWDLRNIDAPFINETSSALVEMVAKFRLINTLVSEKVPVAAAHANTAIVCRDMLSIVHAYGYDKLQYWGFSYGSLLGASFSALFPRNVGRVVLDGVLDATNYYAGLHDSNLKHTDKGLQMVFEQCAESGTACTFHEVTANKVQERYFRLLDSLDKKPVSVIKGHTLNIITKRMVRATFFVTLYQPYRDAKTFFTALRSLEQGDGVPLYEMHAWTMDRGQLKCGCGSNRPLRIGGQESQAAMMCTDTGPVGYDLGEFQQHFENLANVSYFGDIWSQHRLKCVGWKVQPRSPWSGPVVAGNTSFPLLLVGNTEDPVTPDAEKMSHAFNGSVVLTQKSAGHCSIAATSLCTAKAIRAYFRDGTLPEKNTICTISNHMFLNDTGLTAEPEGEEDSLIIDSLRKINQGIHFNHALPSY